MTVTRFRGLSAFNLFNLPVIVRRCFEFECSHSNERTVPSSWLSSFLDYCAPAEGTSTCPLGLGTQPKEGGGGESRAAESRRPSRPAEGQGVSWGPRVPAEERPPLPSCAASPPSQLPALSIFADVLARPHDPGPPSYLPARGLGLPRAAHRGPGQPTADLSLPRQPAPSTPRRAARDPAPRPSAQPAPRLPPARSTHKGVADAMTSLAQARSVGDAAALLGLWAEGTCSLFLEREEKVGCVEGGVGSRRKREGGEKA